MKIVTIGTGFIVEDFIKVAKQVENVEIVGSYSRSLERAKEFSQNLGIRLAYDSLSTLANDDEVNTVYIASPNALHYQQAKFFLENGKHVIIEKPIMSNVEHAEELLALAKQNDLFIFEAISNIHTPNFKMIKENIDKLGDLKLVHANYSQYSSRYDLFKAGETPNVFNPEFTGGALMDLNIYNIQLIYHLFGLPVDSHYYPNVERGIDTSGILMMDYGSFKASSSAAKDSASPSYFMVQGDKGYIRSSAPTNELLNIEIKTDTETLTFDHNEDKHRLYYEIVHFGDVFESGDKSRAYEEFEKSIEVLGILEKSWKQNNFDFKDK